MTSERFVRINGGLLQSHAGQKVCLVGQFMTIDKLGRMIKIKLTDEVVIMVASDTVIAQTFEVDQWIEARGTLENRNKLKCIKVTGFEPKMTETFDKEMYNEMIVLTFEHKDDFTVTEADFETHFGVSDPGKEGENVQVIKIESSDTADDAPLGEMNFDNTFSGDFDMDGGGF